MDDLYREEIIDHYKNPRNFGEIEDASVKVRKANTSCGDSIEIFLKLRRRVGDVYISDVRFKGSGCALSMAAASMLTEFVKGKSVGEIGGIDEKFMLDLLGINVSSIRIKCVLLPLQVLEQALKKINSK